MSPKQRLLDKLADRLGYVRKDSIPPREEPTRFAVAHLKMDPHQSYINAALEAKVVWMAVNPDTTLDKGDIHSLDKKFVDALGHLPDKLMTDDIGDILNDPNASTMRYSESATIHHSKSGRLELKPMYNGILRVNMDMYGFTMIFTIIPCDPMYAHRFLEACRKANTVALLSYLPYLYKVGYEIGDDVEITQWVRISPH